MKLTKKELNRIYGNDIIRVGYCDLQTICRNSGVRKIGYACGIYGWNWDAYEFTTKDGEYFCVCTGYRDLTGRKIDGLAKFEKQAREIQQDYSIGWKDQEKKQKRILDKFIKYAWEQLQN